MAIPNNTLPVNVSSIDTVVFPETCLQAKNRLPTNWATGEWQPGNNFAKAEGAKYKVGHK